MGPRGHTGTRARVAAVLSELSALKSRNLATIRAPATLQDPTPMLLLHPLEVLRGGSNIAQAGAGSVFTSISLQAIAQSCIVPIHLLMPMIKVPRISRQHENNLSNDEENTDLSRLEAGGIYNLSHAFGGLRQAQQFHSIGERVTRGAISGIVQPNRTIAAKTSPVTPPQHKRACYYLLGGLGIGIVTSFTLALWWARSQGDLSAGFTLGSYIIGIDALVIGNRGAGTPLVKSSGWVLTPHTHLLYM
ncbi:hypothetical protein E0Z10_g2518 [Xylaria hypoxylon]|uniref:Uncharacterized protein n=1 Tax=Xylaria hypoxylon TaxID=37992 RepID=A0A4Z0Z3J8_9PEZI|nr:hypothetical protein E0Z10_g2518 [Xylaria hypoxylon]